jgi:hypothetical protein
MRKLLGFGDGIQRRTRLFRVNHVSVKFRKVALGTARAHCSPVRSVRIKWLFVALALITNLGGGPMAWAHLSPSRHSHEAAMPMAGGCHEQAPSDSTPAPPMPCCDGSACECATPPAPPVMTLDAPADLRHETLRAPGATRLVAPDPLDDTLRPPIR